MSNNPERRKLLGLLDPNEVVLLPTNASKELAGQIADKLDLQLAECSCRRFNDGEVRVEIGDDVPLRNSWAFIIGSTPPPMENWGEMWLLADAAVRAAANRVVWVAPYVGYGRQDRKIEIHDPISAALFLELTKKAGVQQIISVDLHCAQLQGVLKMPMPNLWGRKLVLRRILERLEIRHDNGEDEELLNELAIAGPDAGSYKFCWHYAGKFGCILVGGLKTRPKPGQAELVLVGGNQVEGRDVIILEDMSDTSNTLVNFSALLKDKGARRIIAGYTHAIHSCDTEGREAIDKLEESAIDFIVTTDTLPPKRPSDKIEVISMADELAEAIRRTVTGDDTVSGMATKF